MKHALMSLIAVACLTSLYVAAEEAVAAPVAAEEAVAAPVVAPVAAEEAVVAPVAPEVKVAEVVKVVGTVVVVKNAEGVITAVKVQPVEGAAVAIAQDAAGQKIAAMVGKKIEVKGTIKNGALSVAACKAVVQEEAK